MSQIPTAFPLSSQASSDVPKPNRAQRYALFLYKLQKLFIFS